MGWIARSQLASAVSNAGGMGIIETSSGQLDEVRDEIAKMRDLTDKPFGREHRPGLRPRPGDRRLRRRPGRAVRDDVGRRSRRSTRPPLKAAGLTVFHVVPDAARRAEGGRRRGRRARGRGRSRAAGSRTPTARRRWCCCRSIAVAGRRADHRRRRHRRRATMAAAFALGAEGVQMGTRMVSAAESPVHDNWKQAVVAAAETDTVFLNRFAKPAHARAAHRAHRRALEQASTRPPWRVRRRSATSTSAATWRPAYAHERPGRGPHRRGAAGAPDPRDDVAATAAPASGSWANAAG